MILQLKQQAVVEKNLVANYPFNTTFLNRDKKKT